MKNDNLDISIVIPVYNSESCIEQLCQKLTAVLSSNHYEVILVNDGSTDSSWLKILELTSKDKRIKAINFSKNFGQNNALMAGLKSSKGDYVVIMDDDLQHDPNDILSLVNECKKGFDVCFGLFDDLNQKGWKNFGSKINGKIAEWFINKPKEIYLSPFKAMNRKLVDRISQYKGSFPYVDVLILQSTASFTQIELKHHKRFSGKGNFTFRKSLVVFFSHLLSYSVFPLQIISLLGILSFILSFALGVYYLIDYFSHGSHVEGWISLVLFLLFFGGLILFALGIIGIYISRIYQSGIFPESYSISETKNFD